jgi:hypothetical protein
MAEPASLLSVMGLASGDLDQNRAGTLSSPQIAYIHRWAHRTRLLVLGAVIVGIAFASLSAYAPGRPRGIAVVASAISLVFAFLILVVLSMFVLGPIEREADAGKVVAVEGRIDRRYVSLGGRGFVIWVGGTRYHSARTALGRALATGDQVRLFTLPRSRTIVSVERV